MAYKQLTYAQRCQIFALNRGGFSCRAIATDLGVHHTTISRELRRNGCRAGYHPATAKYLDKLPIREAQITQIGDLLSGKKEIEDLISKPFRAQIKAKYNSKKKIKDLLLIPFSEDFYGDATLKADSETLGNLKALTDALKQRLEELV